MPILLPDRNTTLGFLLTAAGSLVIATAPAQSEERRQLGAHEHGRGILGIAFDGNTLGMDFRAPGADIVGFETAAETDAQQQALVDAKNTLRNPAALFRLPEAAGCQLESSFAHYTKDPEHAEHHAKHHGEGKKGHHDTHDHGHNDDGHDHGHGKHGDHHGHDEGHAEFHAGYSFTCAAPDKVTTIGFPYFKAFERAQELEVNVVTASGQKSFEATRERPEIKLSGLTN